VLALRIAAGLEAVSLAVLLINLFTAHVPAISALVGPVHGTAYLGAIAATWLAQAAAHGARWRAVIPGVGGLLAVQRIRSHLGP
jgi:hypothetical protein